MAALMINLAGAPTPVEMPAAVAASAAGVAAAKAQGWAEGTLPGGAGTKSAKEHAEAAEAARVAAVEAALSIGPEADGILTGAAITANTTYRIQRAILNGLPFTRMYLEVTGGTGTVEVGLLIDGVLALVPVIATTTGATTTIAVTVPIGSSLDLSIGAITGAPTALFVKLEGPAA